MTTPSPRFTGIFIPVEVLQINDLTYFEMILLSWIDALYCPEHGGCYASNEYLGSQIKGSQPNTVAKAITNLRKLGLIEDVSFDGRTRVIRALVNRYIDKAQSKSELDAYPIGVGRLSNPACDAHPSGVPPSPYIHYRKDERKDDIYIAQSAAPLRQKDADDISFSHESRDFQNIPPEDWKAWKELYTEVDVPREIKAMVQWILANPSKVKGRKLWRKFITSWLGKCQETKVNKLAYQQGKKNDVLSKHKGFQKDTRPQDPRNVFDFSEDV
jgi:hypothetical protein